MRRLYITIFTLGVLLGMLTGCQNFFCHTAGVCDCDFDDGPCTHRAPWAMGFGPGAVPPPGAGPIIGPDGVPIVNSAKKDVPALPVSRPK